VDNNINNKSPLFFRVCVLASVHALSLIHSSLFYTSNPSASHKSTKTSTICGNGTFCGNRRGGPSSSAVAGFLNRGLKMTSMISSTSKGTATALAVESVSELPAVDRDEEVHWALTCSHFKKPFGREKIQEKKKSISKYGSEFSKKVGIQYPFLLSHSSDLP
jgi:hypothetical protein